MVSALSCSCDISAFDNNYQMPFGNTPTYVAAPWVEITIETGGKTITVGNNSESGSNSAVIKSFQFGASDGYKAIFEIADSEGGNFCNFTNDISKKLDDRNISQISYKWGWLTVNAQNVTTSYPQNPVVHTAYIISLESVSENGYFKYTVETVDVSNLYQQQRVNHVFKDMTLKAAITSLFTEFVKPAVLDIKFLTRDANGELKLPLQFYKGADGDIENGPKCDWKCLNKDPISCLDEWLNMWMTINKRGFNVQFYPSPNGPTLIIKEADDTNCMGTPVIKKSRSTYLVNGGNKSNVISFVPQVKWQLTPATDAGGAVGANVSKDVKENDPKFDICQDNPNKDEDEQAGATTAQPPVNECLFKHFGNDSMKKAVIHDKANQEARQYFFPINADLRIMGDPTYNNYGEIGQFITVVYLNQFKPSKMQNGVLDWTIQTVGGDQSSCNSVFSNKNWMILGFHHDMREGSYTTVLNVILAQPNINN